MPVQGCNQRSPLGTTYSRSSTFCCADFQGTVGSHDDSVTQVVPSHRCALLGVQRSHAHVSISMFGPPVEQQCRYNVRAASAHPVYEHQRTATMKLLIESYNAMYGLPMTKARPCKRDSIAMFEAIGELMFQSHTGYQHCGLGSAGTDRLVMLARQMILEGDSSALPSVFGAKITGGGSGGCVCVATSEDESGQVAVCRIAGRYAKSTQHQPIIVSGSSPGAQNFDHLMLRINRFSSLAEQQQ